MAVAGCLDDGTSRVVSRLGVLVFLRAMPAYDVNKSAPFKRLELAAIQKTGRFVLLAQQYLDADYNHLQ